MMNRYSWILFTLFFINTSLTAQNATLSIGTEKSCAGQEVLLTINGVDLLNVGALTLFINFDPAALTFVSLENIDPQFSEGISYNYMPEGSLVGVAWSNVVAASVPDSKLFDMKFQVNEGSCPVTFASGCEVVNSSFQPIAVNYANGAVEPGNPVISTQPQSITVIAGKNASFQVISPDASGYQWEQSMDNGMTWNALTDGGFFSGSQSNQLSITEIPVAFNDYQFRCFAGYENCFTISDIAILEVDSATAITDVEGSKPFFLSIWPNPFNKNLTVECNFTEVGTVYIKILSPAGQEIFTEKKETGIRGTVQFSLNLVQLPVGMYICLVELHTSTGITANAKKIIKE